MFSVYYTRGLSIAVVFKIGFTVVVFVLLLFVLLLFVLLLFVLLFVLLFDVVKVYIWFAVQ